MSEYIRIKKRIRIWYERIFVAENIRIYSNIRIFNTLWYEKYDTNEYPNIFGSKKWYERIYEYIRIKKRIRIWYERIFVAENIRIYSNIRIFVTLCSTIYIWVRFPRTGKMSNMWHFFFNFWSFTVTKRLDFFKFYQLFWRDFVLYTLKTPLFWS